MISEVQVTPVKAVGGLVAFASVVLDGNLYLGALGVHKRLDGTGYRVVYPTKKISDHQLAIYHPVNRVTGQLIEQAIAAKCRELFESGGI